MNPVVAMIAPGMMGAARFYEQIAEDFFGDRNEVEALKAFRDKGKAAG
jgi:hypothetical protein